MKKVLELSKCGYVWQIDATAIAHHRATSYKEDGYEREYISTMGRNEELCDWYWNNMDWEDVPEHQKRLITRPVVNTPNDLRQMEGEWDDRIYDTL